MIFSKKFGESIACHRSKNWKLANGSNQLLISELVIRNANQIDAVRSA